MSSARELASALRDLLLALPGGELLLARLRAAGRLLRQLSGEEQLMVGLIVTIALFTLLSFLFALRAMSVHLRRQRTIQRHKRLRELWSEKLLDALAGEGELVELWRMVRRRERRFFLELLASFARRLSGPERERLQQAARPWIHLIRRRSSSREPERRALALRTLADLAPRAHIDHFRKALDDPSPLVSMIGARALVRHAPLEHLEAIFDRIDRFSSWSDNFLASMLIGAGQKATPMLRELAMDEMRPARSVAIALRALRRLGDIEAVQPAQWALHMHRDTSVRVAALILIARFGTGEQLELVRRIAGTPDEAVRAHALSALAQIGGEAELPLLLEGLEARSPWIAQRAARGLASLGRDDLLAEFAASGHANAAHASQALAGEEAA